MFRFSKAFFTWVLKRSKFGYNLKRSFFGGAMKERAEIAHCFLFDFTISTLQCPILPSFKDFSTSEADPEIV